MTSNVGASTLSAPRSLGFSEVKEDNDKKASDARVMSALKSTFRPEFINRIDDIIIFNKLDKDGIEKIASLMLKEVAHRISELGVEIDFDNSVVEYVSREGFDPEYGARPLRRTIVRKIEDSFSTAMLEGKIKSGDKVLLTVENDTPIYKTV
jgi:ATP-dependent Clp protease ATP-binding subunit ClpC